MSFYAQTLLSLQPEYDPRHIEAYIRLEHPTLDGLTPDRLENEAFVARCCVDEGGKEAAEMLAQSYGL